MSLRHLQDLEAQWPSCRTREARRDLWEPFTEPAGLWLSACRDIVRQKDTYTLARWLDPGDPTPQDILNFDANRRAALQAHLRCAHVALTCAPNAPLDEFDARLRPIADETHLAPRLLRDLTWTLLPNGPTLAPEHATELYVLLIEEGRDTGVVGLLSLHLMSQGAGRLYPHHDLALVLRNEVFRQAEADARAYVDSQGLWARDKDVRWRLTRPFDNRPIRRLTGPSMGAAFALGLSKLGAATQRQTAAKLAALEIQRVAISAACDAAGRLHRVGQTGPKLLASFDEAPREFLRFIVMSSDCEMPLAWQSHPFSSPHVILADSHDDVVDKLYDRQFGAGQTSLIKRPLSEATLVRELTPRRLLGATRRPSSAWAKAAALGLLTALFGLILMLLPWGFRLEERVGLELLFWLRGVRPPPAEVVVVNVDRDAAARLNLPLAPEDWPRALHARLTEQLTRAGAVAIAFDILFEKKRDAAADRAFAEAIRRAQNVVLFAYLRQESPRSAERQQAGVIHIERLVTPISQLAQAAVALAPFPLPKVPISLRRYWTFKTGAGDRPTLPVVMLQLIALDFYEPFLRLIEDVHPSQAAKLPRDRDAIVNDLGVEAFMGLLRHLFATGQLDAAMLLERLRQTADGIDDPRQRTILRSLIQLYHHSNSRYLNFYGPPGAIATISYDQAMQEASLSQPQLDLRGKAVFVGFSEDAWPEKQDAFHTVFSQADGSDLSGVEIAATAFANLLEDKPVRLCNGPTLLLIITLWGLILGALCRLAPTGLTLLGLLGLSAAGVYIAQHQFATAGTWYPLIIPIGLQLPMAFGGAMLWRYVDSDRERRNIRQAAGYYLPQTLVDAVARDVAHLNESDRVLHGVCLFTDAEQYTTVAEHMAPEALRDFMNAYYAAIFEPVRRHDGRISDVVGDSVLAIWSAAQPEADLQRRACLAALDIAIAIQHFKHAAQTWHLPTRIGLHSGPLLLGTVGAYDRYEYRALGDIVNAASRIEGLNQILGTRILASQDVVSQLDGLLTRELGAFQLVGKSQPLVIHELLCRIDDARPYQTILCARFAEALDAYRKQAWDEAIERFSALIQHPDTLGDGPSRFYLDLCEQYRVKPPQAMWTGVARISRK